LNCQPGDILESAWVFGQTKHFIIPRRAAVLALTWNFGKLTENVSKKKGVNNDDILTKPAAPSGN
jgi:hypothetical protein